MSMIPDAPATAAAPVARLPRQRSFATGRTIAAMILREMSTRYGRSPGGYVWALLEPLAGIVVLAFAFSLMLRAPPLGTSFLLFYATGMLPFNLFTNISGTTARALGFSRALLGYPAVTWVDAILARFLLNLLTSFTVALILFSGILVFADTNGMIEIGPILLGGMLASLLGLGIGSVNCVLGGLYPLWFMAWGIVTRPLMIASGVLFLYSDLPPTAQAILWYNPLIHCVGLVRTGFYSMYHAEYISIIYPLGVAMTLTALGFLFLRRYHKEILAQ